MKHQSSITQSRSSIDDKSITVQHQEIYSGPIPHPEILKKYGDVDLSFPERVFVMAEDNSAANIKIQDRESKIKSFSLVLGQVLTFVLGIAGIASGVFLALKGFSAASVAAIVSGFAPIVLAALKGLRR